MGQFFEGERGVEAWAFRALRIALLGLCQDNGQSFSGCENGVVTFWLRYFDFRCQNVENSPKINNLATIFHFSLPIVNSSGAARHSDLLLVWDL